VQGHEDYALRYERIAEPFLYFLVQYLSYPQYILLPLFVIRATALLHHYLLAGDIITPKNVDGNSDYNGVLYQHK